MLISKGNPMLDDNTECECAIIRIFPAGDNDYIALLPLEGEAARCISHYNKHYCHNNNQYQCRRCNSNSLNPFINFYFHLSAFLIHYNYNIVPPDTIPLQVKAYLYHRFSIIKICPELNHTLRKRNQIGHDLRYIFF